MSSDDRHRWFSSKLPWFIGGMLEKEEEHRFLTHALDCASCSNILVVFFEKNSNDSFSVGHIPAGILAKWPDSGSSISRIEKRLVSVHLDRCEECRMALEIVRSVAPTVEEVSDSAETAGRGSTAMLDEILDQAKDRQGDLSSVSRASLPPGLFEQIEGETKERDTSSVRSTVNLSFSRAAREPSEGMHSQPLSESAFHSPRSFQSGSIEVAATTIPCKDIAADILDVFELPGGKVGVLHVDVPGRGTAAIRNAAIFQGVFASQRQSFSDPAETLQHVNSVFASLGSQSHATKVFYGVISSSGDMSYCSAGHNPATVVRKSGTQEELEFGGPPIGAGEAASYVSRSAQLGSGDTLLVLSDEMLSAAPARVFGEELEPEFAAVPGRPAMAILEGMALLLSGFHADEGPLADDLSILVLRRN